MKNNPLLVLFFRIIPKAFFSRIFGHFSRGILSRLFISKFVEKYNINLDEAIVPENGFENLNKLFVRRLKSGSRKIDRTKTSLVSPVDGIISQYGEVEGTRVLQAKGMDFLLADLLPADCHHYYIHGRFMTIYLSPSDYHRIHSPLDGKICGYLHVPGKLFPVMEAMVNGVQRIFTKNERIVTYINTEYGRCALVKIGAMNVGQISLDYDTAVSNKKAFRKKSEVIYPSDMCPQVRRGDEIAKFNLGSTVIMLFEKGMVAFDNFYPNARVQMGQKLGTLFSKNEQ